MTEPDEIQAALIAEQFKHALDLQQAKIDIIAAELDHLKEFYGHRLINIETRESDHEQRLRSATEGVTQFKTWSGLASGGSSIVSIIALIKSFLGG